MEHKIGKFFWAWLLGILFVVSNTIIGITLYRQLQELKETRITQEQIRNSQRLISANIEAMNKKIKEQ